MFKFLKNFDIGHSGLSQSTGEPKECAESNTDIAKEFLLEFTKQQEQEKTQRKKHEEDKEKGRKKAFEELSKRFPGLKYLKGNEVNLLGHKGIIRSNYYDYRDFWLQFDNFEIFNQADFGRFLYRMAQRKRHEEYALTQSFFRRRKLLFSLMCAPDPWESSFKDTQDLWYTTGFCRELPANYPLTGSESD